MANGSRAGRNRTIVLSPQEKSLYASRLLHLNGCVSADAINNATINQDIFHVLPLLPDQLIDLLFIDPPYNLSKSFNGTAFKQRGLDEYASWFDSLISQCIRLLKPNASIYICGDWRSSAAI